MIDDDTLQREIDREHGPEESERLRLELESQPEARVRYERLASLVHTLESMPAVEPPLDFVQAVMRAVRASASPRAARLEDSVRPRLSHGLFARIRAWLGETRGARPAQRLLLAVGGLALAALGYFAVQGFPPVEKGTQATAGSARRPGEPIPTEGALGQDALVQEFMASDACHNLMSDGSARAALADPRVRAALSQPAVAAAFRGSDLQSAMARPAVQAVLAQPEVAAALANANVTAALVRPDFIAALASPRFAAALSKASSGSAAAPD